MRETVRVAGADIVHSHKRREHLSHGFAGSTQITRDRISLQRHALPVDHQFQRAWFHPVPREE